MTIILMGKAASGKDTLQKELISQGFERVVTATTRQPREGEQDGVDYHFFQNSDFESMIIRNELVEYTAFNKAYYGCPKTSIDFEKDQCIILEPKGAQNFVNVFGRDTFFIVDIQLDEEVRKLRAEGRGSFSEEWWRDRCANDNKRFDKDLIDSLANYTLDLNNIMYRGITPEDTAKHIIEAVNAYKCIDLYPNEQGIISVVNDKFQAGVVKRGIGEDDYETPDDIYFDEHNEARAEQEVEEDIGF